MNILNKLKTVIKIILAWMTYALSFLVPRKKNLWIVLGWRQNEERELFGDNAKYFFLHTADNFKDIEVVWIGRDKKICKILSDKGYRAVYINSVKGIFCSLRAGYTIIDANLRLENWRYSARSRIVQLWHGKSFKKMGFNSPYAMGKYKKITSPNLYKKFYCLIAASKFLGNFLVSGFKMNENNLIITGLPRYDVLFGEIKNSDIDIDKKIDEKLSKIDRDNYKKVIFYAPTFRPDGTNPLEQVDFELFNLFLEDNNFYTIVSLHPKLFKKHWRPDNIYSNIEFVGVGFDLYPLMNKFDLLITDYSSLALDFLLVDVPSILFVYDLDKFKQDMGVHKEIVEVMPGPRVTNFADLLKVLEGNTYLWTDEHNQARDIFFSYYDNHSSHRVVEALLEVMNIRGNTISKSKEHIRSK